MTTIPATVQEQISLPAGALGRGAETRGALTASDLLAMLRRRIVLIISMFIVLSGLAIGGFAAWWIYLPGYEAAALIECISNIPDVGMTVEQQRLREEEHQRFVLTQAVLLKAPTILEQALQSNAVKETGWYKKVELGEHLTALDEELVSAPVRGTSFLRVSIETHRKPDAAIIVNEVVGRYLDQAKKRSADVYRAQLDESKVQKDTLTKDIGRVNAEIQSIAQRLPAGATQLGAPNIVANQVIEYGKQVAALNLELAQLEQLKNAYSDPNQVAVTPEDQQIIEQDPEVALLTQQLTALQQQRTAESQVFGPNHSRIKQLDAMVKAAEDNRQNLVVQKLMDRKRFIAEQTATAYQNTLFAVLRAQEELRRASAALEDQDEQLLVYNTKQVELTRLQEDLTELEDYVRELERIVLSRTALKVDLAQPAIDPLERSSPSLLLLPVGIFFALLLSVGLAVGLEMMDTSVRTSQDVQRHLEIAILGTVPHTDDEEVAIESVETAVRTAPRSMIAEAFRRIRTNLQFSSPASRQRSIIVTSPNPEDGRTTVASNLALVLAQGGRRVLLVDANFRRPGMARVYDVKSGQGLSNILIGEAALSSCVTPSGQPSLDVLPSGPIPPNPAELLGSEGFRKFLDEAVSRYDQVIIDTPPVLLASDAVVVATAADGVILVVRAKASSRGAARRACSLLQAVNAHIFGAVLNAAQVTRGGYYREQLRAYYDYQTEAEQPKLPAGKA